MDCRREQVDSKSREWGRNGKAVRQGRSGQGRARQGIPSEGGRERRWVPEERRVSLKKWSMKDRRAKMGGSGSDKTC